MNQFFDEAFICVSFQLFMSSEMSQHGGSSTVVSVRVIFYVVPYSTIRRKQT